MGRLGREGRKGGAIMRIGTLSFSASDIRNWIGWKDDARESKLMASLAVRLITELREKDGVQIIIEYGDKKIRDEAVDSKKVKDDLQKVINSLAWPGETFEVGEAAPNDLIYATMIICIAKKQEKPKK